MLESKEIYIVNNKEFTDKETAEYYLDLCEAREQYHNTAKNYEEVLNKCECKEKVFVEKVQRDYGKSYQDEFDNWHSERIDVENYRCKCCGKIWTYADFDGKGLCWKHGGNILVKRGTFWGKRVLRVKKGSIIERNLYGTMCTFKVTSDVKRDEDYLKFEVALIKRNGEEKIGGWNSGEIEVYKETTEFNIVKY